MSAKTGQFDMLSAPRQKAISYQVKTSMNLITTSVSSQYLNDKLLKQLGKQRKAKR
jgi:hypothetical protein